MRKFPEGSMDQKQRSRIGLGVLLLLFGVAFLALQLIPQLADWVKVTMSWPLIVIAVGAFILVTGLLSGNPESVIGACVVAGIGGILYYQNNTGDWGSWNYAWTLIPGFSGVGSVLARLFGAQKQRLLWDGLWQIVVSSVLFLIFGSFLGGLTLLGNYWPLLLVLVGLLLIIRSLIRKD
jgi:MFS family permease